MTQSEDAPPTLGSRDFLATCGESCREAIFWSAAAALGSLLACVVIGPRHEHGPNLVVIRAAAAIVVWFALLLSHAFIVRETLRPWLRLRVPVWKGLVGAIALDGTWMLAIVCGSVTRTVSWGWFFAILAASLFMTYATLRLWLRLGNGAAVLSALPLVVGSMGVVWAAAMVYGQLHFAVNP